MSDVQLNNTFLSNYRSLIFPKRSYGLIEWARLLVPTYEIYCATKKRMPFPCLFTPIFSLYKCFMQNPVSALMHVVCLFVALLLDKLSNLAPTAQSESRMCRCILRDDGNNRKKTRISGLKKRNAAEFF